MTITFEYYWEQYAKQKGYDQMDAAIEECAKTAAQDAWSTAALAQMSAVSA